MNPCSIDLLEYFVANQATGGKIHVVIQVMGSNSSCWRCSLCTVIAVEERHRDPRSNSGLGCMYFHIALILLWKTELQLFSRQFWVNSWADWVLSTWYDNRSGRRKKSESKSVRLYLKFDLAWHPIHIPLKDLPYFLLFSSNIVFLLCYAFSSLIFIITRYISISSNDFPHRSFSSSFFYLSCHRAIFFFTNLYYLPSFSFFVSLFKIRKVSELCTYSIYWSKEGNRTLLTYNRR